MVDIFFLLMSILLFIMSMSELGQNISFQFNISVALKKNMLKCDISTIKWHRYIILYKKIYNIKIFYRKEEFLEIS